MNLVGYTTTALSRNDIIDTPTNKNVVDGAIVELKDYDGNLVTIYDDINGTNPETQKTCDTNGQCTFFAEAGDYVLEVNGRPQNITISVNITVVNDVSSQRIWGERYKGALNTDNGVTLTDEFSVLLYDGDYYSYIGSDSFPIAVAAGTVPSEPNYKQVTSNNAENITYDGATVQSFLDQLSSETGTSEVGGVQAKDVGVSASNFTIIPDPLATISGTEGFTVVSGEQSSTITANPGSGCVVIGGSKGQPNSLIGYGWLRSIIGGYDSSIVGHSGGGTQGLACAILTSHHSTISGDSTHTILAGGSYLTCEGGDYNGAYGGTRNNVKISSGGASPTHSFIFGGRDNDVYGPNGWIFGSLSSEVIGEFSSVRSGRNTKAHGNFVNVTGADNESRAGTLGNGQKNTISGGRYIIIDSPTSPVGNTVGGGEDIVVFGLYNNVGGGNGHRIGTMSAQATYASLGGGLDNTITAETAGTVGGGRGCESAGDYSGVTHGRECKATARYSRSGGYQADSTLDASDTMADGMFTAIGDAQTSVVPQKVETTDETQATMGSLVLPDNTTWMFQVNIVARRTDGNENGAYTITGCIKRDSGAASTALVGAPTVNIIAEDSSAWDVVASANVSSGALSINVTGETAKTIRWSSRVMLSQVSG